MPTPGVSPRQTSQHNSAADLSRNGGVVGCFHVQTVAGTSSYDLGRDREGNFPLRVIDVVGIMSGAGAALDTVQLTDSAGNAISDAVDVSAKADKERYTAGTIDDAYTSISGETYLKVATASDALSHIYVYFLKGE